MTPLQQEIEKILKESKEVDYGGDGEPYSWFNETEASIQLQKLFLDQQLIMIEDLMNGGALMSSLKAKREQLKSELKQL